MIYFLIAITWISVAASIECGVGVPILTRIPNERNTYSVVLQCLCPADYYGIQCQKHRKLSCYLKTKEYDPQFVDPSNFQQQKKLSVIMSAQCYIEEKNQKYISFVDFFVKKNIRKTFVDYELESGSQGGEIIWANDSSIMTGDGFVRSQEGYNFTLNSQGQKILSAQDQKEFLSKYEKFKFNYKSQFLGFPFTDSSFSIVTNIYKVLLNKRVLPAEKLEFINYDEYAKVIDQNMKQQEEAKDYIDNFSLKDLLDPKKLSIDEIRKQIQKLGADINNTRTQPIPQIQSTFIANLRNETQFGVLKAEIKLIQIYQGGSRDISVNSAVARIPIRVPGVGYTKIYNTNFYKAPSRFIYAILAILAMGVIYGIYRFYKFHQEKRLKKIKKSVQDQFQIKQFR